MENLPFSYIVGGQRRRPGLIEDRRILDDKILKRYYPYSISEHPSQPSCSLGQVDQLPDELILYVCLELTIPSLLAFRGVNRRARILIESLEPYRQVLEHCPYIIGACVATEAYSFSINHLYNSLITSECATCGNFGEHLYLITCQRVCSTCYLKKKAYLPITATAARRAGTSNKRLTQLPHFTSLPGRYTAGKLMHKKRTKYFDRTAVEQEADPALWTKATEKERDFGSVEPVRYKAIISAPYLGPSAGDVQWGLTCLACSEDMQSPRYHILYSQAGILDHLKDFGPVRRIGPLRYGRLSLMHVKETA
ncbi:hypothetical protein BT63DRAFT_371285 [Microthyrium microscopicum]|uniref:F-box domain-containing protein n=1 Tax=Microthyrium microscopicum TaxID=703497 RepID=A0A6A6UIN6_9PEZI|nr:hypothetical protein BT63DRAFT_371285 [Microthyrium microscopicum]